MAISYFDLGVLPGDVQRAAAGTLQTQQEKGLAVLPQANLAAPIREGLQRRATQQNLALGQRRLDLDRQKFRYQQGMLPWEIGLGAVGAGLNVYGGYRTLQATDQAAARAQQMTEIQEAMHATSTVNAMRQVSLADAIRQALERQAQPQAPSNFYP